MQCTRSNPRIEETIERCLRDDQDAWSELTSQFSPLMSSVAARYRLRPSQREDMEQIVWTQLSRKLGDLRDPLAIGAWLTRVAAHTACSIHRRNAPVESLDGHDPIAPDDSAEQVASRTQTRRLLSASLNLLPQRCRTIMHMLFFEEPARPYREVAEIIRVAEGSVPFLRTRCLLKLRKALENAGVVESCM
jgi:RNA polymerase sigma-70 factor (ECF subfamily)